MVAASLNLHLSKRGNFIVTVLLVVLPMVVTISSNAGKYPIDRFKKQIAQPSPVKTILFEACWTTNQLPQYYHASWQPSAFFLRRLASTNFYLKSHGGQSLESGGHVSQIYWIHDLNNNLQIWVPTSHEKDHPISRTVRSMELFLLQVLQFGLAGCPTNIKWDGNLIHGQLTLFADDPARSKLVVFRGSLSFTENLPDYLTITFADLVYKFTYTFDSLSGVDHFWPREIYWSGPTNTLCPSFRILHVVPSDRDLPESHFDFSQFLPEKYFFIRHTNGQALYLSSDVGWIPVGKNPRNDFTGSRIISMMLLTFLLLTPFALAWQLGHRRCIKQPNKPK